MGIVKFKKLLAFLTILTIVFLSLSSGFDVVATENPVLDTVADPSWKLHSSATAQWSAVEGANYYKIEIFVYDSDVLLGSAQTGTSSTEVDLQQEIHNIYNESSSIKPVVQVSFTVTSAYVEDEKWTYGESSAMSDIIDYRVVEKIKFSTPQNVQLDENYVASWDISENDYLAKNYHLHIVFSWSGNSAFLYVDVPTVKNPEAAETRYIVDLYEDLKETYFSRNIPENAKVYFRVRTGETDELYTESDYSSSSARVDINFPDNRLVFSIPQNVQLDENYVASWDISENDNLAKNYHLHIVFSWSGGNSSFLYVNVPTVKNPEAAGTRYTVDLYEDLKDAYFSRNIPADAKVDFRVYTGESNELYKESDYSSYSARVDINFPDNRLVFLTPQNVQIDENYFASWDISENDHLAKNYHLHIVFSWSGGNSSFLYVDVPTVKNPEAAGTRYTVDLYEDLKDAYFSRNIPADAKVDFRVYTGETNEQYAASGYSVYSNCVELPFNRIVTDIELSPETPKICLGNSLYLGKTISPIDAFYRTIEWTSSDSEIVYVDSEGKITAKAVGTANITAKIDDISTTIPVIVYSISSSTITDEEENKIVVDQAGDIIDDIINNENPDLSDTDISEDDLDDIKDSINDGIDRGDEFFTDITWYEENFVKYKNNWGQIQKAARELNAQFAGAYNIEVEMYHKDKDGEKYHIGNIVEVDGVITFTFDLPTGMKEIESGETKKFVLVRIHKNTIEPIDFTINDDGTFTAQSDMYSDFVWLLVETECSNNNHNYGKWSNWDLNSNEFTRYHDCVTCGYREFEVKQFGNGRYISIEDLINWVFTIIFNFIFGWLGIDFSVKFN